MWESCPETELVVKAGYLDKSCNILIKERHVYVLGISIAVLIEAICVCCRKQALWLFRLASYKNGCVFPWRMIKLIKSKKMLHEHKEISIELSLNVILKEVILWVYDLVSTNCAYQKKMIWFGVSICIFHSKARAMWISDLLLAAVTHTGTSEAGRLAKKQL